MRNFIDIAARAEKAAARKARLAPYIVTESAAKDAPLFEMPMLVAGDDFGLNNPEANRHEVDRLLSGPYKTIESHGPLVLGQRTEGGDGEFFLIDTEHKVLAYYVNYEVNNLPGLGRCATQVILWRRSGAGMPGVTRKVFFDILMTSFDAVVSDAVQTGDGQRFWIDRMAEAIHAGWTVGMVDHRDTLHAYPGGVSLQQWLTDMDGWGPGEDSAENLFFIAKKAPPAIRSRGKA